MIPLPKIAQKLQLNCWWPWASGGIKFVQAASELMNPKQGAQWQSEVTCISEITSPQIRLSAC